MPARRRSLPVREGGLRYGPPGVLRPPYGGNRFLMDMNVLEDTRIGAGIQVFVVEDDEDLREEIGLGLADFGFSVQTFPDPRELYRGMLKSRCDIVVVDIGLPGEDGFSVTEHLRAISDVGIVILSGRRGVEDRVRGLMGGADAWLSKPADLRELAVTLVSVRRRMALAPTAGEAEPQPVRTPQPATPAPEWVLTVDGWALVSPGGRSVSLTPSERLFIQCLFNQVNEVVRREVLVEAMGHRADYYLNHRLDMLVSRLRRKIQSETGEALPLRAVRGFGFILSRHQVSA